MLKAPKHSKAPSSKFSLQRKERIEFAYRWMLEHYGHQGWWPVICECEGRGYHPTQFNFPISEQGRFEICVGAILTQNTAWTNVEKAIQNLGANKLLNASRLLACEDETLAMLIRPAGYFNQKAKSLKAIAQWFMDVDCRFIEAQEIPDRKCLLSVRGIGPETADSILLYAFNVLTFVVDAYTRRIFEALSVIASEWTYEEIRSLFMRSIPADLQVYQEFHALIVEHAKHWYRGTCIESCPLRTALTPKKE